MKGCCIKSIAVGAFCIAMLTCCLSVQAKALQSVEPLKASTEENVAVHQFLVENDMDGNGKERFARMVKKHMSSKHCATFGN
jgi:hypothetical protein